MEKVSTWQTCHNYQKNANKSVKGWFRVVLILVLTFWLFPSIWQLLLCVKLQFFDNFNVKIASLVFSQNINFYYLKFDTIWRFYCSSDFSSF